MRKNVKEKNIPMLDTKDSSGSVDDEIGGVQMINLNSNDQSSLPPLYIDI